MQFGESMVTHCENGMCGICSDCTSEQDAQCPFTFWNQRCILGIGHTAPHMVTLRFDVGKEPVPMPVAAPPQVSSQPNHERCDECQWCVRFAPSHGDRAATHFCTAWDRAVSGAVIPACRTWEKKR